jgi:hypothetical protein
MRGIIVVLAIIATGCAHYSVTAAGHSPSTAEQSRRVQVLAWGALEQRVQPDNCHGNGLAQVTVKVTFFDAAAAVLTLGFWSPVHVQWSCAKAQGGVTR